MSVYDIPVATLDGTPDALGEAQGKVALLVNVASFCGLTPQYEGLQRLHDTFGPQGFTVIGLPCNQFGAQEPGTEEQIKQFCETRFGVTFPMFAKLEVNGAGRHPLYAWLTSQATQPKGSGDIEWNFAKFVIDPRGEVVARFAPTVTPDDPALIGAIEGALPG